ncbi:hypothetical protein X734_12750 [Mesorhizobium sp. L2C084A000]|nr:hypothetical protein X734_12750 [Mesorhizobium sp. L2C084A000]
MNPTDPPTIDHRNGIEHEEDRDRGQEAVPDFVFEAMRFGDRMPALSPR